VSSMCTSVCPTGVVCFSRSGVQSETPSPIGGLGVLAAYRRS
jgi:hypothetical protein